MDDPLPGEDGPDSILGWQAGAGPADCWLAPVTGRQWPSILARGRARGLRLRLREGDAHGEAAAGVAEVDSGEMSGELLTARLTRLMAAPASCYAVYDVINSM
jgi:hypothetical protein